uniref:ASCH domain-containing protein n=1 Tax=Chenopodium quinoa TaxID=63459 RepID=A0A803M5V6_CHEQI
MEESGVNPTSPGVSPVQLNDCLEDLLKFILQSSINGTLGFNLGLSPDFCSGLLNHDDHNAEHVNHPFPSSNDFSEGVPSHPLYKKFASALQQCIISGSFFSSSENVPELLFEDESLQDMKIQWNELISQKGSELLHMLNSIKFELHVQEPYFSQLKDGMKTVEGRCAVGNYNRIQSGDLVFFNKCLMLEVQDVRHYSSFLEMLEAETLKVVLPGVLTFEEGVKIYRNFYTEEKEQSNGVLAISVDRPASQPYAVLSDVIMANFNKNQLANEVITRIIGHCQWLNVHIVQPHGAVFEIRNSQGYGARWSADGTKFIGFLEPYMVNGHLKKWRH